MRCETSWLGYVALKEAFRLVRWRIFSEIHSVFSIFEEMNPPGKDLKVRKDPWARFEAWRYNPAINKHSNIRNLIPGFWWGVGAFVIAIGIEKLLEKPDDHGGHH